MVCDGAEGKQGRGRGNVVGLRFSVHCGGGVGNETKALKVRKLNMLELNQRSICSS